MKEMAFELTLDQPFEQALGRVIDALKQEGFGVLTRIDVHDAMKEKLGAEFRPYTILGACNPPLAFKALSHRPEVGLLLPCNVVVEAQGQAATLVRIIDPRAMMQAGGVDRDPVLAEVGGEADIRLRRVADSLKG